MLCNLSVDFTRPDYKVIDVTQDEVRTRFLKLSLSADGEPFDIMRDFPEPAEHGGSTITGGVNYVKPDGTRGSYDTIDGRRAVNFDTETRWPTVELAPQMFTASGKIYFNVWFVLEWNSDEESGTNKYVTFPICLNVHRNSVPDGVPSTDYYNLHTLIDIQTMVEELEDQVGNLTTDINNIRQATVSNSSAIAVLQRDIAAAGTVKSVNGVSPDALGNVALTLPQELTLYYNTSNTIPEGIGHMKTLNTGDLLGAPTIQGGELIIDIYTGFIGEILAPGEGGTMLVRGTGKHFGGG